MIMNFKFEEDLENNLLLLTVSTERRQRINQPRVRCDFRSAQRLIEENYECPDNYILAECINPIQLLDNNHSDSCSITWKFNLVSKAPKKKPVKAPAKTTAKPRAPKKPAKKTTIKKSKDE